jgi:ankyrin repeat protein
LKNNDGDTPLHLAASNGRAEVCQYLLERGADIYHQNIQGDTPLLVAASRCHLVRVQAGVNLLNDADRKGDDDNDDNDEDAGSDCDPSLDLKGPMDLVQLLLDQGADIDHPNKIGDTLLLDAAWVGHYEVVKLLLDRGADIHHQNNEGDTPLLVAASRGHLDVVRILLDGGALLYLDILK